MTWLNPTARTIPVMMQRTYDSAQLDRLRQDRRALDNGVMMCLKMTTGCRAEDSRILRDRHHRVAGTVRRRGATAPLMTAAE